MRTFVAKITTYALWDLGFGINFGSRCFHRSRECSLAHPKPTTATAGLATWAGCSNEKTPPQLQILNWSEPYYIVEGAIAIAS